MPFVLENEGPPEVENTEEYFLGCLFTVTAAPSALTARRLRAKCYVDEVEVAIKSATWSVQDTQPAGSLNIQLANLADRTAFTRTAEIRLEVEEYLTGSWSVIKTYCDGSILATSNYVLENNGNSPADTFSVTVLPLLQQRLDTTPEQTVVLYDPEKTTILDDEVEAISHIDGTTGTPTVTPIASMNLFDVLSYAAQQMGFTDVKTNINWEPWKLSRVDFPACTPYWNTIPGLISEHQPRLSVDADNYLVIRDGTLTDYVSARVMTLSNFRSGFALNKAITRTKGCLVTQQLRSDDWDYYTFRQRRENQWFGGVSGQYPLTELITWFQDFYKNDFPDTPVSSRVFAVRQMEYSDSSTLVSAVGERFSYLGSRVIRHESREWGLTNAPQSWITANAGYPGPNVEFAGQFEGPEVSFTSASDTVFSEALVLTRSSQTLYSYFGLPGEREQVFVGQTDGESRGLIMKDTENQQLGEDFEQPYTRAQENGNLAEGQGSYWGQTDTSRESQKTERKSRNVSLRTRGSTPLNSSGAIAHTNYYDRRIGDIGDPSDIQAETKQIKITEGADSTAQLWRNLNLGEAPLVVGQPLAIRLNKQQDYPGTISGPLPTYDETVEIGMVFDPRVDGREAVSLGIFEVTGYQDTFSNLEEGGFSTAITAKQIG